MCNLAASCLLSYGHESTKRLQAGSTGDETALEKLAPQVQREPHRLARYDVAGERQIIRSSRQH